MTYIKNEEIDGVEYNAAYNLWRESNRKWTYLKDYIRKHANNSADDRRLVYQRVLNRMNMLDSIFYNNTLEAYQETCE